MGDFLVYKQRTIERVSYYISDIDNFIKLWDTLDFYITGSMMTQVVLNMIWDDSDLDIYYPHTFGLNTPLHELLIKEGYEYKARLGGYDYLNYPKTFKVESYIKENKKIDIMNYNIDSYMNTFNLSCNQIYINRDRFVAGYLDFTINKKTIRHDNIVEKYNSKRRNEKYIKRGFEIYDLSGLYFDKVIFDKNNHILYKIDSNIKKFNLTIYK